MSGVVKYVQSKRHRNDSAIRRHPINQWSSHPIDSTSTLPGRHDCRGACRWARRTHAVLQARDCSHRAARIETQLPARRHAFGGSSCAERGRHDCRRMPSQACGAATLGGAACKVSAARLQLRSSQRTLPVTDQRSMLSGRSDPQRAFCAATDQQRLSSASQSLQPANAAGD